MMIIIGIELGAATPGVGFGVLSPRLDFSKAKNSQYIALF